METPLPAAFNDPVLPETPAALEPLPTLGRANRIYLLLMVLLIGISLLGALLPRLRWFLILAGDPFLLLIVLWAVAREGRPLRVALRLTWPGARALGLGLLLGFGAYAIAAMIQVVIYLIFHQTQGVDIRSFTSDPFLLGVFLVSAVLLAPLTEEMIFRGYFLGIYERYLGPTRSLWLVALLFAALHMQLLGIFSLLPVSILLTYMALRSGSLLPGMAAHFAFNLCGSALGLAGLSLPLLAAGLMVCCLLITGPAVGGVALQIFHRVVPALPPPPIRAAPLRLPDGSATPALDAGARGRGRRSAALGAWLGRYWPLLLAGLIFFVFSALELILAHNPPIGTNNVGRSIFQHG